MPFVFGLRSSGLPHHAVSQMVTKIFDEHINPIFSILNIDLIGSSETSIFRAPWKCRQPRTRLHDVTAEKKSKCSLQWQQLTFLSLYWSCPHLALHGVGVDLTHVHASVLLVDILHVQVPRGVVTVWHGNTWVVGDHVVMYRLNRFRICLHPTNLNKLRKQKSMQNTEEDRSWHQNSIMLWFHIVSM